MIRRTLLRRSLKEKLVKFHGGKCKECDYNKCLAALEFHHQDKDKEQTVSYYLVRRQFKLAQQESMGCELLCVNCHRRRYGEPLFDGTIEVYICKSHKTKWHHRKCQECKAMYVKRIRRELKEDLITKLGNKCLRCGFYTLIIFMISITVKQDKKVYTVSQLIAGLKYDLAYEEIKKCDLLCANCHREVEAEIAVNNTI